MQCASLVILFNILQNQKYVAFLWQAEFIAVAQSVDQLSENSGHINRNQFLSTDAGGKIFAQQKLHQRVDFAVVLGMKDQVTVMGPILGDHVQQKGTYNTVGRKSAQKHCVEKGFAENNVDDDIPDVLKMVVVPMVSLVVTIPVTYLVLAPLGNYGGLALADAYHRSGRKPLADTAGQLEMRLRQVQQTSSAQWVCRYLQEELDFLAKNRRPRAAFPSDAAEQNDWLAVLGMLGARAPEQPLLERVFSLRCLGNSKTFEKHHRARLLGVLRKALPLDTEEMSEEELLRQAGLEKYPEWFSFCGAVQLTWPDGKVLDMTPLGDGIQISAVDASQVQISYAPQVRTLLFVENKANYFDTIRKNPSPERVVVFHGGCFSPQRGRFFQQLCQAAGPQIQLLHWGDIDCGGFQMDSRLRREIDHRIRPWCMDVEQLRVHRAQAEPFSEAYAAKLERLLQDPCLQDSRAVLLYMLQNHLRLEQEALLEE